MIEEKNNTIGVMDSGIGGLTVLKQLVEICPDEKYIYFGDTKNLPYGEKSKEELIKIVKEIFDFFQSKNVKAVVMACNTSSATAYEELKDNYSFKIYPIIQIVSKCVSMDKDLTKIAVMATKATVDSKTYTKKLKQNSSAIEVFEQACPLFVPMVEKRLNDIDEEEVFKSYLKDILNFNPQKIILGCTHYPYLLGKLSKYAPKELFINPSKLFAQYIKEDLKASNSLTDSKIGSVKYFASSEPEKFKENAKLFLNIEKQPELIIL